MVSAKGALATDGGSIKPADLAWTFEAKVGLTG